MTHANPATLTCKSGIRQSDGYVVDCHRCQSRRWARLKRGETYSPTGYPGEAIDNREPAGRIVAHSLEYA